MTYTLYESWFFNITMFQKHIKFFNVAKSAAELSNHRDVSIGSIIVYKRNVVSVGYNQSYKTHPLQKHYDQFRDFDHEKSTGLIHAEIDAIIKARRVLDNTEFVKATIYVYRVLKTGEYGMCRPCGGCMAAIKDTGITNVFYTTPNGFYYENISEKYED